MLILARFKVPCAIAFALLMISAPLCSGEEVANILDQQGDQIREAFNTSEMSDAISENDNSRSLVYKYREVAYSVPEERVAKAREFIGFLQGRLRIDVPDWWKDRIFAMEGKAGDIYYPSKEAQDGTSLWTEDRGFQFTGVNKVIPHVDGHTLQFNGRDVPLTHKAIESIMPELSHHFRNRPPSLACAFIDDRAIVAYDDVIACLDSKDGSVLWNRTFTENLFVAMGSSGPDEPFWDIRVVGNDVCEFVGYPDSMRMRIVNLTTGKTKVRFNTLYALSKKAP